MKVRIATRKSPLALWQARHVAGLIERARAGVETSLVELSTQGDRFLQAPLSEIGGKGLFVKEIEQAVLAGEADLAVHSLKDMTSQLAQGLCLAAVPEREDPRDAFVSPSGLRLVQVPHGGVVGTSSQRRACQVLQRRPDLRIVSLRGNVQTRLRKTAEEGMAGAILALAGLRRLGLEAQVTEVLPAEVSLPAVGQGALALECREDDAGLRQLLSALEHGPTRVTITAERAFLSRLEGGCTVPLAAHAVLQAGELIVHGLIGRPDGTRVVRGVRAGPASAAERLGIELAEDLLAQGGGEILQSFAGPSASREP